MLGAKALGFARGALEAAGPDGGETRVAADKVLVAVGRRPRTGGFGLERLDLAMAGRFIRVDDRCATSMRNVWAIGDVTGEPMLAHRAMAQGEMVAEIIAGARRAFDHRAIPAICFTDPEIVGGRSFARGREGGARRDSNRRLPFPRQRPGDDQAGGRGVRAHRRRAPTTTSCSASTPSARGVSELSAAFALALEMGARLEDVAGTIHAHPTRARRSTRPRLKALGKPLHI